MDTTIKGEVVKQYLEKYNDLPTLSLAKLICKENSELFNDVEQCRGMVRYYRGAKGEQSYERLSDRRFLRDIKHENYNPFNLPISDEKEFEPFILPKSANKILILSDVHLPYHSIEALTAAIEYGQEREINTILLNGDILDFHQLSNFIKDPRKRHWLDEKAAMFAFLDAIQNAFPNASIYYKLGNHEERFEMYMKIKAPELYGDTAFELDTYFSIWS